MRDFEEHEVLELAAALTHEANSLFRELLDPNATIVPAYFGLGTPAQQAIVDAVEYVREHADVTPEEIHEIWMRSKAAQGWTYGGELDYEKKTHPNLIPFHELTEDDQLKDKLFIEVAKGVLRTFERP